jgi:hypothetical protein
MAKSVARTAPAINRRHWQDLKQRRHETEKR